MRDRRWIGAFSLFFLLSIASGVSAQEATGEGEGTATQGEGSSGGQEPSAIQRARDHMERGQALYLQARFEEAAAEFEAAYEAQPFGAFLFNAGASLERAGQAQRAAEMFEQYITRDPNAADAEEVRARIARLRGGGATAATGEMPDEVPDEFKSLVSVRTSPEGATVRVMNGPTEVASGPAPFAHTLDAGRYTVRVEHPDYTTVEQQMRVEPGKVYVIIVEMSQGQFLGYLRIVTNVPGANVFIDDREQGSRGQTPFEAPIAVGEHNIWIERPGYRTEETQAEVNVGEDVTVRVDLTRVDFGRLRVVSNITGAQVLVDGQLMGAVPFEGEVGSGPHRLRIESDGMKAFETQVDIRPGQLTPVRARLRPDVGRGGAYVSAVFSALFLGAGIGLGVVGLDFNNTLQAERDAGTLASDDARIDQGFFIYIAADAAFGLSLVVGVLALYYFIYDPLPPSEGTVQDARDWALTPIVDPERQTGGLSLTGRF